MAFLSKKQTYNWNFENIGGTTRVRIATGEDIAHLSELDPKMWTVLSCPTQGLEIDEKSLSYIDYDQDGKIRVQDVIHTAEWITGALKDLDLLVQNTDRIDLNQLNAENEWGKKIQNSAQQILNNLGKTGTVITLDDTADRARIFANTRFNGDGVITENTPDNPEEKAVVATIVTTLGGIPDRSGTLGTNAALIEEFYQTLFSYKAWKSSEVPAPFGENTDAIIAAYQALDSKVKDFFLRSKLAAFSPESATTLDLQKSHLEAISTENLAEKTTEIAAYPLVRITGTPEIQLDAPINPAWSSSFDWIRKALPEGSIVLTETTWSELKERFSAYLNWKNTKTGACVETLGMETIEKLLQENRKDALLALVAQDAALQEEADNINLVDQFLHILRDFHRLLRNFITFHDFYDKDKNTLAIFQSGTLIIDQRACLFCMQVSDTGKHSAAAANSGMYLIYCDCFNKAKATKQQIVATMTVGSVGDICVGKNAIYYDNNGVEWDAVVTKIIDNPISIGQAFWSPYRRLSAAIENLINKNAADKDAKIMQDMNAKLASAQLPVAGTDPKAATPAAPPFDIAKVAGIFAAIGMAFGMIATALADLIKGVVSLSWWQIIILFFGLLLAISGPAMVMAWLKLRRRNLSPLLNANGWAVNAISKISIPFGATLTESAHFPKLKLQDPYKKKGLAPWKQWTLTLFSLAIIAAVLVYLYFNYGLA